jgi:hypothetical protein
MVTEPHAHRQSLRRRGPGIAWGWEVRCGNAIAQLQPLRSELNQTSQPAGSCRESERHLANAKL